MLKQVPDVAEVPLLGSSLDFARDGLALRLRLSKQYPDIRRFHILNQPIVAFDRPDWAQLILTERMLDFERLDAVSDRSRPVLGYGLVTALNRDFRPQRRMMQPAFNHSRVAAYGETMVADTLRTQADWQDGATLDIQAEMMQLTMQIIGKTMFSRDLLGEAGELGATINAMFKAAAHPLALIIPQSWPTPRNLRLRNAISRLNQFIYALIDRRREQGGDNGDLLAMLLAVRDDAGQPMSNQQLRDELITIFLAGHETTALALTWTFWLLATHPGYYDRLQAEVDAVLGGRPATAADVARLPFTTQVIKEAMRLYPPAHAVARTPEVDAEFEGYFIPKHTTMLVDIYAMHHHSNYFPQPEQFDPDRFSPEREKLIPKGAYLPFGTGPRVCIGSGFAMMEAQLLLATISQHLRFQPVAGHPVAPATGPTLRAQSGGLLRVQRKEQAA